MSTPKINSSQIKACVNEIENYEQILEMWFKKSAIYAIAHHICRIFIGPYLATCDWKRTMHKCLVEFVNWRAESYHLIIYVSRIQDDLK
jgi:hypothetical protein